MNEALTLSQIQKAFIKLCNQPDLDSYAASADLTAAERSVLDAAPRTCVQIYSTGTIAKRLMFSRDLFALTRRQVGAGLWDQLTEEYWQDRQTHSSNPYEGLREMPSFLRGKENVYPEAAMWADLAQYELLVTGLEAHRDDTSVSVTVPTNIRRSKLIPVINSTAEIRSFDYDVNTIAHRLKAGKKAPIEKLVSPIKMIFYFDPDSRIVRGQVIADLVAEVITLAQREPIRFCDLFKQVRTRLQHLPVHTVEASMTNLFHQLQQVGIVTTLSKAN